MSATVIPASQAHFRVLDYMGGDSTITEFPVTFCLLFLQSSCPCDVFESSRCSKMNANFQVLCITDFDKLSILSKILRVYSHLPKRREFSKRKFASPRGHIISLFCSCEIFDCSSIPFTSCYLEKRWPRFAVSFRKTKTKKTNNTAIQSDCVCVVLALGMTDNGSFVL